MGTDSFQIFWIACCLKWKLSACSCFVNFRFCKNNLNLCKNRAHLHLLSINQFFCKICTNFLSSKYFCTNVFISCWHVFYFFFFNFRHFRPFFQATFAKMRKRFSRKKFENKVFVSTLPVTSSHNTILSGLLVYPCSLSLASPLLQNKSGAQLLYLSV